MSDANNVDISRVETLLGDLVKSLNDQPAVSTDAELIAKGADALVEQQREANDNLAKSIAALHEVVAGISSRLEALTTTVETKIEKSLSEIANQPMPARAVQSLPEASPADPVAAPVALSREDVISKALVELKSAEGARKLQLLNAIAKLDTNYAPAEIAAELNLR